MERRNWLDIEPGKYSLSENEVSKKTERFISGELKKIFRINSHSLFIGLTIDGKHAWQQEEEQKGDIQYCTGDSGTNVYFRALQRHS